MPVAVGPGARKRSGGQSVEPARVKRTALVRPPGRRRLSIRTRRSIAAWLLALPWVAVFAVFMAGPVAASFAMSFTAAQRGPTKPTRR